MSKNLYVIQESKTIFPGLNSEDLNNKIINNYFKKSRLGTKKNFW